MSIAVIQMASQADIQRNLRDARELLARAAEAGARLAVLPENFAAMGHPRVPAVARAEAEGCGPILPWLATVTRELGLWLVAGTIPLPPDGAPADARPAACSLLYDDQGRRVARYDKLHLFDAEVADSRGQYRESDDYVAGQRLVLADTPVGRLGLTVCYDLRFAELYGALRAAGAELIAAPSAFTQVTGEAHWDVLIRARAIDTQCYLLAAAQGGEHAAGRRTHGHSAIVDPWGRLLGGQASGPASIVCARDAAEQAALRRRMPLAQHRRFSVPCLGTANVE
ncbi:carbon-nitrogen hydrolase family protein [Pseudomonas oligotrophica]|uniref:carbon-nitrogen hydrolase family protein n=1 Tax=Pseudomonas oligotrophica TaxID=2912055 RepID=UPI001F3F6713|nr:carbon-nitrogen hydrolase family protein [Pseudomonas oligotrophica]MCF7203731.1 carbon-nitrogen hydrolase family protein [Pseudomonas oligotrophica]